MVDWLHITGHNAIRQYQFYNMQLKVCRTGGTKVSSNDDPINRHQWASMCRETVIRDLYLPNSHLSISTDLVHGNCSSKYCYAPDSKVHGANIGPIWVLSAPDRPHVGPMNLTIRGVYFTITQGSWGTQQGPVSIFSSPILYSYFKKDICKIVRGRWRR